jgi:hypothetical protein
MKGGQQQRSFRHFGSPVERDLNRFLHIYMTESVMFIHPTMAMNLGKEVNMAL